jgi:hypothetical protein
MRKKMRKKMKKKMRKKIKKKMLLNKMRGLSSYSLEIPRMDLAPPTPNPLLWRTFQDALLLTFSSL